MQTIIFAVHGLSHNEIAEEREEWVKQASGKRITLKSCPTANFPDALGVFSNGKHIGFVAEPDVERIWLCMNWDRKAILKASVTLVDEEAQYWVMCKTKVKEMGEPRARKSPLAGWVYDGPVVEPAKEEGKLGYLLHELQQLAEDKDAKEEDLQIFMDEFCKLAIYDFSREMQASILLLRDTLISQETEQHNKAFCQLQKMTQKKGGSHWRNDFFRWLKEDFEPSERVYMAAARVRKGDEKSIREALAQLPNGLAKYWAEDDPVFVEAFKGLHLTITECKHVISCLAVNDFMDGKVKRKKKAQVKSEGVKSEELPVALNTREGRKLLEKARKTGWLDENWQPAGLLATKHGPSKTKASVLACVMSSALNLTPLWEPFEKLWNMDNLRIRYSQALNSSYFCQLDEEIKKTLR